LTGVERHKEHKSVNGKKDFWARGDGWVFAALAKVLDDLPKDNPHRAEYLDRFRGMAQALKESQAAEGYWTRSILDPAHAPGPETSGTAFFVYGYQPIGDRAIPGQVVDKDSTTHFGVGAYLLAAAEMVKYLRKQR
jgi:rhamnogalacturonyl hydrolase YesR